MSARWLTFAGAVVALLITAATLPSAVAGGPTFSTLYKFEAPAATTFTSPLGSQPDTLPVVGPDGAIYGMTSVGGQYGNGVIYRFDRDTHQYTVLHTFSALNANGENADGATPGMALTRGPNDVIYGMASFGGQNGSGTIFKFNPSGEFTVLHTFSALDANGHNQDGAYPLRAMVVGNDGNLYGTTRLGGPNTCLFTHGCGVAWMIDGKGNFKVIHPFTADEGHAASLLQGTDGQLYGCAVWPATSLPAGPLPSGILYRMATIGAGLSSALHLQPDERERREHGWRRLLRAACRSETRRLLWGGFSRRNKWQRCRVQVFPLEPRGGRGCPRLQRLELCRPEFGRGGPRWPASSRATWDSQLEHRVRRRQWQRRDLQPHGKTATSRSCTPSVQRMQQQEPMTTVRSLMKACWRTGTSSSE